MAPPIEAFPPSLLPYRLQTTVSGKLRKPRDQLDLSKCALNELVQYDCNVDEKRVGKVRDRLVCNEIVRLFRR